MPKTRCSTPRMLSEADLVRVGDAVRGALYRGVYDLIEQVRRDVVDELRFAPLAAKLEEARHRRGLDLRAAAKLLKVPQYVLRQEVLHQFEIDDARYVDLDLMDDPDPDGRDARATRLADLGLTKRASFLYEYDFGDGWNHLVTVEEIREADAGASYPRCVAGERSSEGEGPGCRVGTGAGGGGRAL